MTAKRFFQTANMRANRLSYQKRKARSNTAKVGRRRKASLESFIWRFRRILSQASLRSMGMFRST
jgi:hypothetical protein